MSLAAIALVILWPPAQAFDLQVQIHFFDAASARWIFPPESHDAVYWLLYRLPKILLSVAAGAICLLLLWDAVRGRWSARDTRLLLAVCVLGLTALIVGMLKNVTGVSCPAQEIPFAGPYPHIGITDRLFGLVPFKDHLQCWPAGHASAGFGLLGYRLLAPAELSPPFRYWWPGLVAGWGLGIFQMARGQHYLSHTVVTMALAILLSSLALAIRDRLEQRG
ncbi:MAG: phosphatase PAP2 family protein [Parvibaculum sp.]|nr:phosphatase PAP2 family protein [Parvibaculum sp.]